MSEERQIITGDFIDKQTGMRFVEDIRGNFHCCYMEMSMPNIEIPAPIVNVSPPVVNVDGGDNITNNYITNNYSDNLYVNAQRIILQNRLKSFTWQSDTLYNRINASASGYINYTVPFGKEFHINLMLAAQYGKGDGNNGVSYIGIFVDGNSLLELPLISEMSYEFESPIRIPATSFVEFKFLPYTKKVDLGITIIGHTI